MGQSCQIDFGAYFFFALALLLLPLDWLGAAMLAAIFHELCHFLALKALRVSCVGFQISAGGVVIETPEMNRKEEILTSAAGPLGSFLLLAFTGSFPQLAVSGLVQGCFNLLPIYPLDGGRIAKCVLGQYAKYLEWIFACVLIGAGAWISWQYDLGLIPVILCVCAAGKGFLRKFPCNADELGVQ